MQSKDQCRKVLLVVDVQEDAVGQSAKRPYKNTEEFIQNVNAMIAYCEQQDIPVLYIRHEVRNNFINRILWRNRFIEGTPGIQIDPRVKVVNSNIYSKNKGDAFTNPKLISYFEKAGIDETIIIGLDAAACVYHTSIGAQRRGYHPSVVANAIITSDMGKMPRILERYRSKGISCIEG